MTSRISIPPVLAALALSLAGAPSHAAGLFRAYLAPAGSDANPCTLVQPCRLLPAALAAVADGGEIWMLDSANYNVAQVEVTKSVTILAVPGAVGSVVATGGSALNIATAGVKVALRNLVLVPIPGGGGTRGITMTAGDSLTLQGCVLANMPAEGISVAGPAVLRITDSIIRDNMADGILLANGPRATLTRTMISGNGATGVTASTTASSTTVLDIADSTIDGNALGVYVKSSHATGVVRASIRDSRLVRNGNEGALSESGAGGTVALAASANVISNNGTGLRAYQAGKIWATGNTLSANGVGLHNDGGTLETAGNNAVRNNTANDALGPIAPVSMM
jgi:hypothetical protein